MSEPPPGRGPEAALESVSDAFENVTAPLAHKPGSLAALLTVVAPGMGHVFLAVEGQKRTRAFILLAATLAAVVLSCFVSFLVAAMVYLGAVAFGLMDLREEIGAAGFSDLGAALAWRIVIAGGVLLVLSLLFPWYRDAVGGVSVTATGFAALKVIDVVLLVIGAGAAALGVVSLSRGTAQLGGIAAAVGALALLLVVFRLLVVPSGELAFGIERSFGLLLAYAASVLLAGGGAGAATSRR